MTEDDFLNELKNYWVGRKYKFEDWMILEVTVDQDGLVTYMITYIDPLTRMRTSSSKRTVRKSVLKDCIKRFKYERCR